MAYRSTRRTAKTSRTAKRGGRTAANRSVRKPTTKNNNTAQKRAIEAAFKRGVRSGMRRRPGRRSYFYS